MASAFLVTAPHSGAGKTTVTLALLAAFRARGLPVQAFKVGPDYIDPAHHARLTGSPSHNLDSWMLPAETNRGIFASAASRAEVAVVEGVMGLYDGVDGRRAEGSSAHLAQLLDLPVVLVVNARSMARSAAALVKGFAAFEPGINVVGVIWNRVGSASHRRVLDEALEASGLCPPFGAIPRDENVVLPERHLGLVTPEDADLSEELTQHLAALAEAHVDLETLLRATSRPRPLPPAPSPVTEQKRRIGVAHDAAYCFYYEDNFRILREGGYETVVFRPVEGDGVPPDLAGLYLGGGYPEVHASRISKNEAFLDGLRELHHIGVPIYAECGGFMSLCQRVEDLDGRAHRMAGIFPTKARMSGRQVRLGYREVEVRDVPRLNGLVARGHEFHYSYIDPMPESVRRAYVVRNARGEPLDPEGFLIGNTLGGYIHLHFGSSPQLPRRLFNPAGMLQGLRQ